VRISAGGQIVNIGARKIEISPKSVAIPAGPFAASVHIFGGATDVMRCFWSAAVALTAAAWGRNGAAAAMRCSWTAAVVLTAAVWGRSFDGTHGLQNGLPSSSGLDWLCDTLDPATGDCLLNTSRCISRFGGSGGCGGSCDDPPPFLPEVVRACTFESAGALRLAPNVSLRCDFADQISSGACSVTLAFGRGVTMDDGAVISAGSVRLVSPSAQVRIGRAAAVTSDGTRPTHSPLSAWTTLTTGSVGREPGAAFAKRTSGTFSSMGSVRTYYYYVYNTPTTQLVAWVDAPCRLQRTGDVTGSTSTPAKLFEPNHSSLPCFSSRHETTDPLVSGPQNPACFLSRPRPLLHGL